MFKFLRSVIATTIGTLLAFFLIVSLLYIWFLSFLAEIGEVKPQLFAEKTFLVFDLNANIADVPHRTSLNQVLQEAVSGPFVNNYYLLELISAIDMAAQDPAITGIFIRGELTPVGMGCGYAVLKEVRESLKRFKEAGKPVYAYLATPSLKDYYLASVATTIALNPFGEVYIPGLAIQNLYFGDAFKKFGIGIQTTREGKYKSAFESFTSNQMSPEDRVQEQLLLGQIWENLLVDIASERKLDLEALKKEIDKLGIFYANEAQANGLVDELGYLDEVINYLVAEGAYDEQLWSFRQVGMETYIHEKVQKVWANKHSKNKVAVIYAEGEIVGGEGINGSIGAETLSRYLREVRLDNGVKAVVLRVNSPGGGVIASEIIQREVALLSAEKPVIVSFGSYAASGGYWISLPGHYIFAEPTTITGSIGVIAIMFNVNELASKVGVNFDGVKTAALADIETVGRPKTPQEIERLQIGVDYTYDQFIKKVAHYRNMDPSQVEEIAQGRVWSGQEALKLGLVDAVGGLRDAILEAVHRASLGDDWAFYMYPQRKGLADTIAEMLGADYFVPVVKGGPVLQQIQTIFAEVQSFQNFNDPRGVYLRMPSIPRVQ